MTGQPATPRASWAPDHAAAIRNAAINVADEYRRLTAASARLNRAIQAARDAGVPQTDIYRAVAAAATGRPDRARALEALGAAMARTGDTA